MICRTKVGPFGNLVTKNATSQSEILDWLSLYGEVLTEITEEPYEDVDEDVSGEKLPPVGNGTYLVKMKLKRDMPNWVPMYGRKVSFSRKVGLNALANRAYI